MSCCVRSRVDGVRGVDMIEMRRAQLSFGDGLIAEEVSDLREDWMRRADRVLADEQIVAAVYEALAKRHPKSRSRGRRGIPAETVLRLLILKHIRNLSYEVLEREVRANLVYRDFARVGGGKMPDAKTMGRWGLAVSKIASDRPCFQAGRRRPGDFGRERRELRVVYARIGRCQGRPAWRGAQAAVPRPYPAVTCHVGVNGGRGPLPVMRNGPPVRRWAPLPTRRPVQR